MEGDRATAPNPFGHDQIIEGTMVYDIAGDKVGSVQSYDPAHNCIVVQTGLVFHHRRYIPADAISRVDAAGVSLSLYRDVLDEERYAGPPAAVASAHARGGTPPADTGARTARDQSAATVTDHDDVTIPIRQEELGAGTHPAEAGRVRVHQDVAEERQARIIPLTHEEVRAERVPVGGRVAAGPDAFEERDFEMPLMGERNVTKKRAHVVEDLHLHTTPDTEQQRVTDTLRGEHAHLEGQQEQGRALRSDLDHDIDPAGRDAPSP